jgi:hypothetical protein
MKGMLALFKVLLDIFVSFSCFVEEQRMNGCLETHIKNIFRRWDLNLQT